VIKENTIRLLNIVVCGGRSLKNYMKSPNYVEPSRFYQKGEGENYKNSSQQDFS